MRTGHLTIIFGPKQVPNARISSYGFAHIISTSAPFSSHAAVKQDQLNCDITSQAGITSNMIECKRRTTHDQCGPWMLVIIELIKKCIIFTNIRSITNNVLHRSSSRSYSTHAAVNYDIRAALSVLHRSSRQTRTLPSCSQIFIYNRIHHPLL